MSPVLVQHVNVKLLARQPSEVDLEGAIPVFHRWIRDSVCEEMLIDVADYRHVPAGPGVVLIGHEANYSLDLSFGRLGLLYNRKSPRDGSPQDNLLQAFFAVLVACRRLEEEPEFLGNLNFDAGRCDVVLNDRLIAPNTGATWQALRPEFQKFFDGLYGSGRYALARVGEPRERFRVSVEASEPVNVRSLLEEVQSA
jgi:hypothetical protein